MKRIILSVFSISLSFVAMAQNSDVLKVKEARLSNGMTVWLNEDHSQPKVYGAVVVKAGAKDCPNTGIAHYFEHILFKGTEEIGTVDYQAEKPWLDSISAKYDQLAATKDEASRLAIQKDISRLSQKAGEYAIPNEFNRLISKYGGSALNAGTSWDFTYYHNIFTPQYMAQWCQLNSDRLINPVFRLFQGELETVYEEKNMYADDMMSSAMEKIFLELFQDRPYAYPVIGSTENLKNPKLSEMREFYKKYYVACNMGLVLCGDFDSDNIMPLLEQTFGRIPRGVEPPHVKSPLPDITSERTVEIKIPVPLVSIEMLAFKTPTTYEKDANALDIAFKLLSNGQAGMLDSLTNEGTFLMAVAQTVSLNDAGCGLMVVVPNLLASKKKAEGACLNQLRRIINGDFSDEMFNTLKLEAIRESNRQLETISNRAEQMVEVMASGHTWQEYLDKVNAIRSLTKNDVVTTAKKYLNAPFVRFKKKNGEYAKDKVTQPDYKPVVPKNKNAESEYAKRLAAMPVPDRTPRMIDFAHDAGVIPLNEHATLYTVKNPVNDLFQLELAFNRGLQADKRLSATAELLSLIGTDSLTRQQLETSLQTLGASFAVDAGNEIFKIMLTGIDEHFDATVALLGHFLSRAQSNDKSLDKVRSLTKADSKSFGSDNKEVLRALIEKVQFGDNSSYLTHITASELKKLSGKEMLDALSEVFASACYVVYSGKLEDAQVKGTVAKYLPVNQSSRPYVNYGNEYLAYDQPVVYVYDMPKSRQTLFFTYEQLEAMTSLDKRIKALLLDSYIGGGMSSVLFQEVREFRSMAYSTGSMFRARPLRKYPNSPTAFLSVVGTQGDKAMSAISLVDSLLRSMPLNEHNFTVARQEMINNVDTKFPSFREIGETIALIRWKGYDADPNSKVVELANAVTFDDMINLYKSSIQNHQSHRVLGIVGNVKKLDMKALENYGKVVMVKQEDVYRK